MKSSLEELDPTACFSWLLVSYKYVAHTFTPVTLPTRLTVVVTHRLVCVCPSCTTERMRAVLILIWASY